MLLEILVSSRKTQRGNHCLSQRVCVMESVTMTGVITGTKRLRMLVSHNTLRRIVLSFLLLLTGAVTSLAKEWRGIVPLHSTRADVERLLGVPTIDRSDTIVYE